jgi:Toprim domain
MSSYASELSRRLASNAEAVCRTYLPNGRRQGRYWTCGDAQGRSGRSLFVKLFGEGSGKWTDAATGEHGDLLDLIRLNKGHHRLLDTLEEASAFLNEPKPPPLPRRQQPPEDKIRDTPAAAGKLFAFGCPVPGTLAENYLRGRGIAARLDWPSLRFHPACYYRTHANAQRQSWPALLGAVTDLDGKLTGLQRTFLARDGGGKAPLEEQRKAMGHLLGNAVRFGEAQDVLAAGEGIETVLSLLSLFPALPMAAALSSAHLSAILFPPVLRRFYMLRDNDAAGDYARERLGERAREAGIEFHVLSPLAKDLNADIRVGDPKAVRERMLVQLSAEDQARFAG